MARAADAAGPVSVLITPEPLSPADAIAFVTSAQCGGISVFIGTTRDSFEGKGVQRLEYECYESMAAKHMRRLGADMRARFGVHRAALHHRTGVCPVAEASVVIAAASEHRKEALDAVAWAIDALKATVPIWKREVYTDGAVWKQNAECAFSDKARGQRAESDAAPG